MKVLRDGKGCGRARLLFGPDRETNLVIPHNPEGEEVARNCWWKCHLIQFEFLPLIALAIVPSLRYPLVVGSQLTCNYQEKFQQHLTRAQVGAREIEFSVVDSFQLFERDLTSTI
jgi:hypothetical protein